MDDKERIDYQAVIEATKKTKEYIHFAMQLEAGLIFDYIKPSDIPEKVLVDKGEAAFFVERDWKNYSDTLKKDFANFTKMALVGYSIVVYKEYYQEKLGRKGWSSNSDLYAAQRILKVIRNVLCHLKARKEQSHEVVPVWDFKDPKDRDLFEVKSIGVTLDTRNLQDKEFCWNQIGGFKNFIKVLDYLEEDLNKRALILSSRPKEKQENPSL